MIVPRLDGGLGNQMFQIAAAIGAANMYDNEYGVNYDLPHSCIQGHKPTKYKETFFKDIPTTDFVPNQRHDEPHFHYDTIPDVRDVLLCGYFQSDRYFEGSRQEIKDTFLYPEDIQSKICSKIDGLDKHTVGVHVRRGDYLKYASIHLTCTLEYYKNAINKFSDHYIVIASDDIPWCEQNLNGDNVIFSNCKSELEDMCLLSCCDSCIMSNSSFSWWGAYLGKIKDRVICPKKWFGPDGAQDYFDIYVDGWEKI